MRTLSAALALLVASGCGYTSEYSAPVDGRPRAVWRSDRVVVHASGAVREGECATAVAELSGNGREAPPPPASGGYYTPRFYGPPILVVNPGFAPSLPHPPLFFSPSLAITRAALAGGSRGGRAELGGAPKLDTKGMEEALVYLAVVALLVLPVVDTTLALAPAESARPSADAIDEVNAWNDLLRWSGSPCAPPWPEAPSPAPAPTEAP